MTATDLAVHLRRSLEDGGSDADRLRLVRQFVMDLECVAGAELDSRFASKPPTTGDPRYDAMIAGVVEDHAFHHDRAVPIWTADEDRFLDTWWFLTSVPALHPTSFVETPAALANRGVFVRRESLINR